jgi:protein-tyrosine phosphatase
MKRVLFVCLGNICRSPLAEGLFTQKLIEKGLQSKYKVDSAGTSDYHIGELPDERTRENAEQNGLRLNHRGRQFSIDDFRHFDLIVTMDQSNLEKVLSQCRNKNDAAKVILMRHYESDQSLKNTDVPDPYYGGEKGFQNVYDILDRTTENLLEELER